MTIYKGLEYFEPFDLPTDAVFESCLFGFIPFIDGGQRFFQCIFRVSKGSILSVPKGGNFTYCTFVGL
jgi:hypothetical protein